MRLFLLLVTSSFFFTAHLFSQDLGLRIAEAARSQIDKTLSYDPSYQRLGYPMGDVPLEKGVCSDVVIRALRGIGIDLQQKVHEDMDKNFQAYPKNWDLKSPDSNIDHRRVPNLETYFRRSGYSLPVTTDPASYQTGDIVSVRLSNGLPHIMIVSDKKGEEGRPWIIHNIGAGARLEDDLFRFKIIGHYRLKNT